MCVVWGALFFQKVRVLVFQNLSAYDMMPVPLFAFAISESGSSHRRGIFLWSLIFLLPVVALMRVESDKWKTLSKPVFVNVSV